MGITRQVEIWLQKQDSKVEAGPRDQKQNQGWVGKAAKEEKGGGRTRLSISGLAWPCCCNEHPTLRALRST